MTNSISERGAGMCATDLAVIQSKTCIFLISTLMYIHLPAAHVCNMCNMMCIIFFYLCLGGIPKSFDSFLLCNLVSKLYLSH